jgi:hypothetical protein
MLLNVSRGADANVGSVMPVIGLRTASVIYYPGATVTIHVLLNEAVLAQHTVDRQAELESNGWPRCQDENQECPYEHAISTKRVGPIP